LEPRVRSATSIGTAPIVPTVAAAPVATDAGHSGPTAKVAARVVAVTTSPTDSADAARPPPPIVTVAALARHAGRGVGTSAGTALDVAADAHHDDPTVAADLQGQRSAAGAEDGAARQTGVVRNDGVASPSVDGISMRGKDIATGAPTTANVLIYSSGVAYGPLQGSPAYATPAFIVFDGYVDFVGDPNPALELSSSASVTYFFSGLDSASQAV